MLQRDPRLTAIVASNDQLAFGVIQAACQLDLQIPRDLSISGFDDIPMVATLIPPLTTVRQPMVQIGQTAVDLLMKRLKGEPIAQTRNRLDTEFVMRDSTGTVSH